MQDTFVHLHVHSEYSLVDGLCRIDGLVNKAAQDQMPALAITEAGNLFSTIKFYKAAQRAGVKPIIGAELTLIDHSEEQQHGLLLLCQDMQGYHNLTRLITKSYREGQSQGVPLVSMDWLQGHNQGLIALSCARHGNIGQAILAGNMDLAKSHLDHYLQLFPERFYLEVQRTGREGEQKYIHDAITLALDSGLPVVATNDVRFLEADDYEAHEARICIQQGYTLTDGRRPRLYSNQQYLRTAAEMQQLFSDIPEALENAVLIAQRCNLELTLGEHYLPDFPIPDSYDQDGWLRHEADAGLKHFLSSVKEQSNETITEYQGRLQTELDVITSMGFSGYFLIVADFIHWAKENGIPVGPGRGSGAGSLVAFALGITELDPIQYDLLFERFLNPERVSLPDFDVDFCMDRRDEVIEYVAQRYGRDHVSQIITHGSMAAKAVVRDVGRVLGYPYGFVDQIAKLVPFDLNMTLTRALQEEQVLKDRYDTEDEVKNLIDLALKLEGITRNAGRHAGGIVIAPKPLTDYMPLYCEQGAQATVTQFDMGDVEAIGLVKFDFLGLRTLTIIDWSVRDINIMREKQGEPQLDIRQIPLDDESTYQLIQKMDTTAVFQLESDGMKKLIGRLKPDKFDELIALVALFRPGPLQSGMVDDFVDRKHGRARVQYPHRQLEPILDSTYGVILYQEQVMQIAQVLAGYTLGAADLLRRAMGKKKPEEMAKQREIFTEGAVARNVDSQLATYIFDLMEKFAGYGFNKSHSAAYALVAYQTAWLKSHYPAAFMAAVLSSDMDNTDKVVMLLEELRHMQIKLEPPDVNTSQYYFTVADEHTIRYGLGAIKGVGEAAIENIKESISQDGPFGDLFEMCQRLNLQKVNRRVLEALVHAGALDNLGPGRSVIFASLNKAIQMAEQLTRNNHSGQDDFFGFIAPEVDKKTAADEHSEFINVPDWSDEKRLQGEKETLGFYLKGHPIIRFEQELKGFVTARLNQLKLGNATVAGYIHRIRTRTGARGKMAEIKLDDRTAHALVTVYSDKYQQFRNLLIKDQLIVVIGEVVADDFVASGYAIVAKEILSLNQYRERFSKLFIKIPADKVGNGFIKQLQGTLDSHRHGSTPIHVEYNNGKATCNLNLGQDWKVNINDDLIDKLTDYLGPENVRLLYKIQASDGI